MIELKNISKVYKDKTALDDVSVKFPQKGLVIIKGESGSGKSTLLNIISGNDFATQGTLYYNGTKIDKSNAGNYNARYCANVYQDFMLIEDMTVGVNIDLALQATGEHSGREKVYELLDKVGLPREYYDKKVIKLSGGEKQRVAVARAFAKREAIIFADEPTGNLDSKNGEKIMSLLKEESQNRLVIVVSHNEKLNEKYGDYYLQLVDGKVESYDIKTVQEKEQKTELKKSKSRIKPSTLARLTLWGFEKNRIKTVLSVVTFIMIIILFSISLIAGISDAKLAMAESLDNFEYKNVFVIFDKSITPEITEQDKEDYYQNIKYKPSKLYKVECFEILPVYDLNTKITEIVVYDKEVGADVEVIAGDFPQIPCEIMLPEVYARAYMQNYFAGENLDSIVGKKIRIGGYYDLTICGVFGTGVDFDKKYTQAEYEYLLQDTKSSAIAFAGEGIEEIIRLNGDFSSEKTYNIYIKDSVLSPLGYDKYASYGAEYAPLSQGEVYIGEQTAQKLGINRGDVLNVEFGNIFLNYQNGTVVVDFTALSTIENATVKDVISGYPEYANAVIIEGQEYLYNAYGEEKPMIGIDGFYHNAKEIKNNYAFFSEINKFEKVVGDGKNDIMYCVFPDKGISITAIYSLFDGDARAIFTTTVLLLLSGLLALGFLSSAYLVSSKGNSYNILRSLGFNKKVVFAVIFSQLMLVAVIEFTVGLIAAEIVCNTVEKVIVQSLCGVSYLLAQEIILPLGWAVPITVISLCVFVVIVYSLIKVNAMYSKSFIKEKTG